MRSQLHPVELGEEGSKGQHLELPKEILKKEEANPNIQAQDKRALDFIHKTLLYEGDDPFPEKLFERPQKGVTWGLGGEILKVKKSSSFFQTQKYLQLEKSRQWMR